MIEEHKSESIATIDNKKAYFCGLYVRNKDKVDGTITLGLETFDNQTLIANLDMVTIPVEDFANEYRIMYFWLMPYTWTTQEIDDFESKFSNYYESKFNIDHPNNASVYHLSNNEKGVKLVIKNDYTTEPKDIQFVLPVVKEVALLSFSTTKLEALSFTEL